MLTLSKKNRISLMAKDNAANAENLLKRFASKQFTGSEQLLIIDAIGADGVNDRIELIIDAIERLHNGFDVVYYDNPAVIAPFFDAADKEEWFDDHNAPDTLREDWSEYLGTWWVSKDKFNAAIENGVVTLATFKNCTVEESKTVARFLKTVKNFKELKQVSRGDDLFLRQLLSGAGGITERDLIAQGLLPEGEDTSRSREAEARVAFFNSLSQEEATLWELTRIANKLVSNVYGAFGEAPRYDEIDNFDTIAEKLHGVKGEPFASKPEATVGVYTILNRIIHLYEAKLIDRGVMAFLADTTSFVVDSYLVKRTEE